MRPAPETMGGRRARAWSAGVLAAVLSSGLVSCAPSDRPDDASTRVATPAAGDQVAGANEETATAPAFVASDARFAGAAAYRRGDVAAAIMAFETAVDARPDDPAALNDLGQALVRANRADEAIDYFDRAVRLSGATWAYHFNRARAYAELRQWPRAIEGYRDAARLFPDDYVTEFNLAIALQANGDLAGALSGFEHAIALAPGQADYHLSYGRALEAAQRPADALLAYRHYLELAPSAPDAAQVLAHAQQLAGEAVPAVSSPAP